MKKDHNDLVIVGANEHNLKNVSLRIPRDTLTVFTGVSGSGKSSLAFDTVFKEGQRRYVESLSSYARQFLGQTDKPKVEHIEGLSPTISVDQKTVNRNPRSTVGTITEIYDHFRLLFARLGQPHCPQCGTQISSQTPSQITDVVYAQAEGERGMIMAPMVMERKGEYRKELSDYLANGYLRARIDGEMRRLDEEITLARYEKHSIYLVVDRLVFSKEDKSRFEDSLEKALNLADGLVVVHYRDQDHLYNQKLGCPTCNIAIPELEPRLFSFNDPQGACPTCNGLGTVHVFHEEKLVHPSEPLAGNCFKFTTERSNIVFTRIDQEHFDALFETFGIDLERPWKELPKTHRDLILNGNKQIDLHVRNVFRYPSVLLNRILNKQEWPGVIEILKFVNKFVKSALEKYQESFTCTDCNGSRLNSMALAVLFRQENIKSLSTKSIEDTLEFFQNLELSELELKIGRDLFREISNRLKFLNDVGVGYLNLNRSAATLSGGEGQRIRLASQVGSGLQGVLYVLDEPSIGLHQSDNKKLINTLKTLRDKGNTVFVVEHDEETVLSADHIVDVGPTAGSHGGHITAQGSLQDLIKEKQSLTGRFLGGFEAIEVPKDRRPAGEKKLVLAGATLNNLQNVTISIPLGTLVAVAGVSGSGKSSLIDGTLRKALAVHLNKSNLVPGPFEKIEGLEHIDRMIEIDQSPIGRTPRSNPATYTKVFDEIRKLFTLVPESKARGYKQGRFSFNVKGGRCEDCEGAGLKTIEMQFLADVQIPCDTCRGRRFNEETLQIFFKGKTIYDILEMTVEEGADFFQAFPKIHHILRTLMDVGLSYIHLGQPSTTLSGGEAQRVKLASELRKRATGKTFYILDEPTTGLHFYDIRLLLKCLQELVDQGNTVVVIEHNLDVLKVADHIIELGPGGGKYGGKVVAAGTPEAVAEAETLTGSYLQSVLSQRPYWQTEPPTSKRAIKRPEKDIVVRGASKNNLRHVDVTIPANSMTVITGVSGSGKTSLAFDTIFAEGQARYVESLSTYARRFLGRMDKAPVDSIEGLAPAIAINQKSTSRNPRSTVATTTEIYDYLRLLFARIGQPHCPHSGVPIRGFTASGVVVECMARFEGQRIMVIAPLYRPKTQKILLLDQPDHLKQVVLNLKQEGYHRVQVDKTMIHLDDWETEGPKLKYKRTSQVDLVVDRLRVEEGERSRLAEAAENAYQKGHGMLKVVLPDQDNQTYYFTEQPASVENDYYQEGELTPRMFSFNSHVGACPICDGLGSVSGKGGKGVVACPTCNGDRLKPQYLAVRINGHSIMDFCRLNVSAALEELRTWELSENEKTVAEQAMNEIHSRLTFLNNVGLSYLQLGQAASTLSGGEAQRIRLASQMGSGLMGVMYVLDEPTIGLHPRDTDRLLTTLKGLRDLGNTVILVEHDPDTISMADHLIDIGPGAGYYGGRVVAQGTPAQVKKVKESLTGQYLSGKKGVQVPAQRRRIDDNKQLTVNNASDHNLKDLSVSFPLGVMTVVTGVSGSGKSTLVVDILQKVLQKKFYGSNVKPGKHGSVEGIEFIDKVMIIDQEPIGRSPRSNPCTYSKVMDPIRNLFAMLPEAIERGYTKRRFSFNSGEGRCLACEGMGYHLVEMHFLSDVWIECDQCKGARYNRETLKVTYKGQSIADVLNLEVNQAVELFEKQPRILRILKTMQDVGLGYIKLGQAGNTLSGGESQRLKLSAELAKRSTGKTLYILDEPTTGLHMDDVARLLGVLHQLVDQGNTVIMIEHNLDVIKTADWLIDLGPEGGVLGGELLFEGRPEDIVSCAQSHTAKHLAPLLATAGKRKKKQA